MSVYEVSGYQHIERRMEGRRNLFDSLGWVIDAVDLTGRRVPVERLDNGAINRTSLQSQVQTTCTERY